MAKSKGMTGKAASRIQSVWSEARWRQGFQGELCFPCAAGGRQKRVLNPVAKSNDTQQWHW